MSAVSVVCFCLWEVLIADQIMAMAGGGLINKLLIGNIYTLCEKLSGTFEELRDSRGFIIWTR